MNESQNPEDISLGTDIPSSNFFQTLSKVAEADEKSRISVLGHFLKETFVKDFSSLVWKNIVYSFSQKQEQLSIQTKDKVVLLFQGFCATPGTMVPFEECLQEDGLTPLSFPETLTYFNLRGKKKAEYLKKAKQFIKETQKETDKIVLFGYSMGGTLAHRLGGILDIPSVSYSAPVDPKKTPFAWIGNFSGMAINDKPLSIPPNGTAFSESLSVANSGAWNHPDITNIPEIYSHFSINNPNVSEVLLKAIQESFDEAKKST